MIQIKRGGLSHPQVIDLLQEHLDEMQATSPPDSVHALDLSRLKTPDVQFYSLWSGEQLAACGAFKLLDSESAEIKSMRTAKDYKNQGLASALLIHLIKEAKEKGLKALYLETGSMDYFKPAHNLYLKHGFQFCDPFGTYNEDPNSFFMSLNL